MAHEVGDDVGVEEVTQSELDGIEGQFGDRWKILIEWSEGCERRQKGSRRGEFDDQSIALLPHDGVLPRELEFPGNSHSLVAAVLEEPDMSFRDYRHRPKHMLF
ncbi:MAG: hypothetical protein Q7J25_03835 [Vicinamibacterales bacterium]|nr:hypothetical protein [Vicinamibacterales bacterium]